MIFLYPYSKMAAFIVSPFRTVIRQWPSVGRRTTQQPLSQHALCTPYDKMAVRALVQYVVLRGDLRCEPLSWPLGALVAQACHAALAVTHAYYDHPDTGTYLAQGGSMRTVVLEAPDESALTALAEALQQNGIDHKVWTEQPENIPTCIALRPYPKEDVHRHLKKFKLLK
ncbi:putative peptidyl-tRNA hydrolase PTRHD1 [Heteronotia binoei]|uniref:putative peptidyl-tRNA hydrolase PTRHD1 n=1 Tax=Heteronotia binoei TaxID=13085 RepID=UPI00292DD0DC|nr:putative peptidyl-tRNA hydrolase PTRHD1 [Heteronotia binoei]